MFRKYCILWLSALLFILTSPSSLYGKEDIFDVYGKHLEKLQDTCKKIEELIKKREQLQEQERARRRAERESRKNDDDDDDDNDDSDDREQRRKRRRQIVEQRKKIQEQLNQTRAALTYDFMLHEQIAKEMQSYLKENHIAGDFSFERRSKDITKVFNSYGIGFDYEKGIALRHSSVLDPAYSFALLSYDLACLQAAGITGSGVPSNYTNFSTYFRFYEQLEFYRFESKNFGSTKPTTSKQIEMKRRMVLLQQSGKALHRLLLKNNKTLAESLDLPGLLNLLQEHYQKYLFLERTDFDERVSKILNSVTNDQKKLIILKRDLTFRAAKFDPPANELREAKISGDTTSWFEVKKERKRKRSKRKKLPPPISQETMYFADDMSNTSSVTVPAAEKNPGETTEAAEPAGESAEAEAAEKSSLPPAAELRKFRKDVDAFRRDYAGTHALSVEGLSEDYFPVLKQTMTPEMWTFFEKTHKQLKDAGKAPHSAAAEAYIKTYSAERENQDQITVETMEQIRKFMKEQQE